MNILLTGCNGQLGRELRTELEHTIPGKTTYTDVEQLDITDSKAINNFLEQNEYTHIVNCAAYTDVNEAENDPTACYRINADAVTNIASAASRLGIKVLHISTDYVFDGNSYKPYREADKVNPISNYGTSKRKGEMVLLSMCPDAVIIRTSWLYSPHGKNFVKTMLRMGHELSEIKVVSDQIGTPTYARDLAKTIITVLTSRQWVSGIFHFSNEGVCSWFDFAKSIHRLAGIKNCNIIPVTTDDYPTPVKRPPYSVLDKSLIKRTFGIEIPYWEESLHECIDRILTGNI